MGAKIMQNKPLMQLENVSMIFERKEGLLTPPVKVGALVDVNITLNPGEIIALVGESGCGKTTMGNVITGLLEPSIGRVLFNGNDIRHMNRAQYAEFRNGVQMVQQDSYAALNPTRTIFQSLSAPILGKKIVKNKGAALERVKELLKTVELNPPEQYLDKYPHQLSGGQRQRILLARAISLSPKIIVADEPVSMIDVSLRVAVLNLMSKLNKELGIAFIYITHDLATARYIAQHGKIVVMYLGKVVETGNILEILNAPKHPYLQALVSAVPVPDPKIAKAKRSLPLRSIEMPDPSNPPKGCRFNPRCPYAFRKCEEIEPELLDFTNGYAACHKVEQEQLKLQA